MQWPIFGKSKQKIQNSLTELARQINTYLQSAFNFSLSDFDSAGELALKYPVVFSCCRVLAEAFCSAPIAEYKKTKEGGKFTGDRERTDFTGLYDVLHDLPNPDMAAFNFNEMSMFQLNLGGNFYSNKIKAKGENIVGLSPLLWQQVKKIERDVNGTLIYKIKKDDKTATEETKTRSDIFHVPGPSLNGIIGMSPIEYAANAVKLGMTYEQFCLNFIKNGALSSGIFKHPGFLKDDSWKRLKKQLIENYQGLVNVGIPMLLEDNMDFKELTMKLADAELLASKKFQIEDICRVYRVPAHMVVDLDKATFSNIEQQSLEFVMYTMLPWFKRWESCINTQLVTREQRKEGYYFEYNISGLLRGDSKAMAEAFSIGRQWGWLSVNDIRRLLNMNSIGPSGNIYLQPMNMIEAGTQVEEQTKAIIDEVHGLIESKRN